MRRVQEAALDLFERLGFDAVRVEDIAAAAEVGPATVYRHFGTKERIVLWDEYDPGLFAAIAARLAGESALAAVEGALTRELDRIYAADGERILRRARLVEATPALGAISSCDREAMRAALAELFLKKGAVRDELEAAVVAGAAVAALHAAVAQWARERGERRLAKVIRGAFRRLARGIGAARGSS
jgi:AcrR family transcriptional regulator